MNNQSLFALSSAVVTYLGYQIYQTRKIDKKIDELSLEGRAAKAIQTLLNTHRNIRSLQTGRKLSSLYIRDEKPQTALAALEKINPSETLDSALEQQKALLLLRQPEPTFEHFNEALSLYTKSANAEGIAEANCSLALHYLKQNKTSEANKSFEEAVKQNLFTAKSFVDTLDPSLKSKATVVTDAFDQALTEVLPAKDADFSFDKDSVPLDLNSFDLKKFIKTLLKPHTGKHYKSIYTDSLKISLKILKKLFSTSLKDEHDRYFFIINNQIKYFSHLRSDKGDRIVDQIRVQLEGWFPQCYLPARVAFLITLFHRINNGEEKALNCIPKGISVSEVIDIIVEEIFIACETAYCALIDNEQKLKYMRERIQKLKHNEQCVFYTGFSGHAMYVGFKCDGDQIITTVYNRGGGSDSHSSIPGKSKKRNVANKRIIPFRFLPVEKSKFPNQYLENIIDAKSMEAKKSLPLLYDKEGKYFKKDPKIPKESSQTCQWWAGNCVLKSFTPSFFERLNHNRKLYLYFKDMEKEFTEVGSATGQRLKRLLDR